MFEQIAGVFKCSRRPGALFLIIQHIPENPVILTLSPGQKPPCVNSHDSKGSYINNLAPVEFKFFCLVHRFLKLAFHL